jgi:hypothetical protein
MKKLSLNPDALRVESFRTDAGEGARGTVGGAEATLGCTQYPACPRTQCTCGADITGERAANVAPTCWCCA